MQDVETFIREHVRRILSEKRRASRDLTVVRGRIGKGDFKRESKLAGSLADKDPESLMKKLGLSKFMPSGGSPEEKVLSLIEQAITGVELMRTAYSGASLAQGEDGVKFIRIAHSGDIKPREAVQYLFLVLVAASATGKLKGIGKTVIPGLDLEGAPGIFFEEPKESKQSKEQAPGT